MIYVLRANNGQFYRRGALVRNAVNASFGDGPSSMKGVLARAKAAFPHLTFEPVPLRHAKVMGGIVVAHESCPACQGVGTWLGSKGGADDETCDVCGGLGKAAAGVTVGDGETFCGKTLMVGRDELG